VCDYAEQTRELEHQFDFDVGELDSWKPEIDRWTFEFNKQVHSFLALPVQKCKH
jgi:hypothetical protein